MVSRRFLSSGLLGMVMVLLWCAQGYGGYRDFFSGSFRTGVRVTVGAEETVSEELLAAGANVRISGDLRKGLKAFGANVSVPGTVSGEMHAAGANLDLSGTFNDKVSAAAANIVLAGSFEKDVEVAAAKVTLTPSAAIKGDFTCAAAILDQQEGSQVLGKVIKKQKEFESEKIDEWRRKGAKAAKAAGIIFWLFSTAALIVVGLIVNTLFPDTTDRAVNLISDSPWVSIGVGLVFLVVVPVAIVIALITVVGIPAAIMAGLLYAIMLYISRIYIGIWIGRKIIGTLKRAPTYGFFWPLVVGIVIIGLIGLIPFVGWLFRLFCLLISLGALWLSAWRSSPSRSL